MKASPFKDAVALVKNKRTADQYSRAYALLRSPCKCNKEAHSRHINIYITISSEMEKKNEKHI